MEKEKWPKSRHSTLRPFRKLSVFPKGVRVQRPNLQSFLKEKSRVGEGKGTKKRRKKKRGLTSGSANRSVWKCPEKKAVVVFV